MRLFLSYASEDTHLAEQIYLTLTGAGHNVFFDRTDLPPGGDYTSRIRQAIVDSELFVFLISDNSVAESAYTLTELACAQDKQRHPEGFVLPVMIGKTDYEDIPNYLKAVTILEPKGSIAAEVAHEIAKIADTRKGFFNSARQFIFKHWLSICSVIAILIMTIITIDSANKDSASDAINKQLETLQKRVALMEANAQRVNRRYETLKQALSQVSQQDQEEINSNLTRDLATEFGGSSNGLNSEIESILQDPTLPDAQKSYRVTEALLKEMKTRDQDIVRQSQYIKTLLPSSPSIDVETMKLKRMIDKRSQMFDILLQIIDRYNITAKSIINSMGR